jgi:hypothetical protein
MKITLKDLKNNMKIKFITAIYSDLNGTDFGGRPSRGGHYRWSLLSLLKMTDADFVCYTSNAEYDDLYNFFHTQNNISEDKLKLVKFNLSDHYFSELFKKYKDINGARRGDRCIEIQYMKFIWFLSEDMSYDYYYWIDAGLSHCGLIPNKYLTPGGPHNRGYYESPLFNNTFLSNLIKNTEDKFTIIGKENDRNYWSGTVNPKHFFNYDRSYHIIGGLFGGKKELWDNILELFKKYVYQVTEEDGRLYHEEDIMTLMYRNHEDMFKTYQFDTWWHENERIAGLDMLEHLKSNKSFYKVLEELNGIYE